jgi:DNA-binding MltR family transcriptional regulator
MGGGKKRKRRKEIDTRAFPLGDAGLTVTRAIGPETDRGCVLVASEFISDALGQIFRKQFTKANVSEDGQFELLNNTMAPLFNFGMRITYARAFGLVPASLYEALQSIRSIRNPCAHRAGPVHLADPRFADDVRALDAFVELIIPKASEARLLIRYAWEGPSILNKRSFSSERLTFMDAALAVWGSLYRIAEEEERPQESGLFGLNPTPLSAPQPPQAETPPT